MKHDCESSLVYNSLQHKLLLEQYWNSTELPSFKKFSHFCNYKRKIAAKNFTRRRKLLCYNQVLCDENTKKKILSLFKISLQDCEVGEVLQNR